MIDPVVAVVLSSVTFIFLLLAGWFGGKLTYVHRIGVTPAAQEPVPRDPG